MPSLDEIVPLFYPSVDALGRFDEVTAAALPDAERRLLAHHSHMTVAVEEFYHSPVDVRVLAKHATETHYARKILLARQSDGVVVQFGIMRVNLSYLDDKIRREIESETTPLGRVLINHNVLREVQLVSLWKIEPGEELRRLLAIEPGHIVHGRTALIHVGGEPAVELLEIVTPVPSGT